MKQAQVNYRDYFQLGNPLTRIKSVISYRARVKMYARLMALARPAAEDRVLDMGVTPDVSLPESNFFEKMYPHTACITMATVEDASNLLTEFPGASFVAVEPGKPFPFADRAFELLFCSAVLEHVGDAEAQQAFVAECTRVAGKVFLTTPNRWFPIEFHTYLPLVHYLPRAWHQRILRALRMPFWADTRNLNLLSRRRLGRMVPEALRGHMHLETVRLVGVPTNLILYVQR